MKITYVLETTVVLVKEESGYWSNTPLKEFLEKAQPEVSRIEIYVKEGALEPKLVPARFKIKSVTATAD